MVESVIPGSETAFLLVDVARLWRQAFENELSASSVALNPSQMRALIYIARYNGSKQRALADIMNVSPMTLSVAIDALEKAQLIRRDADPADKRATLIWLTPTSEAALAALSPIASETYEKAMRGMNSSQKRALTDALKLMRQNLVV